jgi:hypothetical protein
MACASRRVGTPVLAVPRPTERTSLLIRHVSTSAAYREALARLREVLGLNVERPTFAPRSVEIGTTAREVARAAGRAGISGVTLSSLLGRLAAEVFTRDIEGAVKASRAMVRWVAEEYSDTTRPRDTRNDA